MARGEGGWRAEVHRLSTRAYGPSRANSWLSWIADERLAVGSLPTAESLPRLAAQGITHVVNCRSRAQTWLSQDLAMERALFTPARVVHAPMWDNGRRKTPDRFASAVLFAAAALGESPGHRVLIHCQQGRRRSVLVAYAVLRVGGREPDVAARLIATHRREADLVPAYLDSVEDWLRARND
jgi:protein-tyrosine phosphatase